MIVKTRGLVLRNTNYSENSLVVKVFTEKFGIQSFLVNGIRNNKGQIKLSVLQPLNLLDMEIYLKPNGGLQRIKEARPFPLLYQCKQDMAKCSVGMFMLELLNRSLPEEDPLEDLFLFLHDYIVFLEQTENELSLVPQHFMLQLCRFLGFFPELEVKDGYTLNLNEGRNLYEPEGSAGYTLNTLENELLVLLQNRNPQHLTDIRAPKPLRVDLLNKLLLYYQLHITGGKPFKSISILQQVLHSDGMAIADTFKNQSYESR